VSHFWGALHVPTNTVETELLINYLQTHLVEVKKRRPQLTISPVRVSDFVPGNLIVNVNGVDYTHRVWYNDPTLLFINVSDPRHGGPTEEYRQLVLDIINEVPSSSTSDDADPNW
jgi:hypothetical protein